jgi:tRNA/tmRNA/rRNA uracil-C5-methylase (TrmA/RlmC/RlmD family)
VVFVRHALPGERVRARVTFGDDTAKFWRADAVEILTPSPDRVEPPCPWAAPDLCGGCDFQHATPAAQRALKSTVVTEQLARLAGLDRPVEVEEVDPVLGWRTRVHFAVTEGGRAGLRKHRSHDVVPIDWCRIADESITALNLTAERFPAAGTIDAVAARPDQGDGSSPMIVVEAAEGTRTKRLTVPHVQASIATRDREGLHRLRGRTWVSESVMVDGEKQDFRVTGTGFWQVHPAAAQTLLDVVLAFADPRPGEKVLDLYSGVGLFAAGLARRVGPEGSVLAVESEERAIKDARRSLHDLPQVLFEADRAERVVRDLAAQEVECDLVVLDPPRTGAGRAVIDDLAALRPRAIVYVACDPAALARDIAFAASAGYELTGIRAFDLFPMTHHVECVALLTPA